MIWSRTFGARLLARRRPIVLLFALLTVLLGWQASGLHFDAAFDRLQPARHPYSQVDRQYRSVIGGAAPVRIAMTRRNGDIYDPAFLVQLKGMTDAVASVPGIDMRHLRSLVTPELKQVVITEGNYYSSSIVPEEWLLAQLSKAQLAELRASIARAGLIGRYVSIDARSVLIEAAFLEVDAATGERYDQRRLEQALRERIATAAAAGQGLYSVQLLGDPVLLAAWLEELPGAAAQALIGLVAMLLLASLLLGSVTVAAVTLACALLAAVWQFGLVKLAGLSLAPEAVFACWLTVLLAEVGGLLLAVRWLAESADGARSGAEASLRSWQALAAPAALALLATAVAAVVLRQLSDVGLLRDVAASAALGLLAAAVINALLLPVLLGSAGTGGIRRRPNALLGGMLERLSKLADPTPSTVVLVLVAMLLGGSLRLADRSPAAAAELGQLSADNPARLDGEWMATAFPRAVDSLVIVVETAKDACTSSEAMTQIDRLAWWLRNVPGVTGTASLPQAAARVLTAFAEGSPKFAVLARDRETLNQAVAPIPVEAGLNDRTCTTLPVTVFLNERSVRTLTAVSDTVLAFNRQNAMEFFAAHPEVDARYCAERRQAKTQEARRDCPVLARPALGSPARILALQQSLDALRVPALAPLLVFAAVSLALVPGFASLTIVLPLALAAVALPGLQGLSGVAPGPVALPLALLASGAGFAVNLLLYRELREARLAQAAIGPAWRHVVTTAGRGAVIALLVAAAGTAPWLAAVLPLQREVGITLLASLLLNLLLGLLVLPAVARFETSPRRARDAPRVASRS